MDKNKKTREPINPESSGSFEVPDSELWKRYTVPSETPTPTTPYQFRLTNHSNG